jgi:DNA-binding transcriptional LysR family regulator
VPRYQLSSAWRLASGALVRVLEDWCPPFAGFFLYYPSRKQQPAALVAVIETVGKLIFSLYLLFIRKEDGKGSTTFTLLL